MKLAEICVIRGKKKLPILIKKKVNFYKNNASQGNKSVYRMFI